MNARVIGLVMLLALPLTIGAICLHARSARSHRAEDGPAIDAVAVRLPGAGLALSGGARWLREPGFEESTAPFVDGIGAPDPDPAGAAFAPSREIAR
jgi:hypothetical protein